MTTPTITVEQLKNLGFDDTPKLPPRRLVAHICGKEGTGKTHCALTAPDPVVYYNVDIGTEGVVEKFQQGTATVSGVPVPRKQVLVHTVRVPKSNDMQQAYVDLWEDFKGKWEAAYGLGRGTVVLDTATEAWELARLARLGKLTQVMPHNYVEVNKEWREMLRLAYDSSMNTVLINKLKPVWVNNQRTDRYEAAGFSDTGYTVQITMEMVRQDTEAGPQFSAFVTKCRQRPELMGRHLVGPNCSFEFLLNQIHGVAPA